MNKKIVCGVLSLLLVSCINDNRNYPISKDTYENGKKKKTVSYINDSTYILIKYYDCK